MRLSKLKELLNELVIINDCEINSLGMATSKYDNENVLSFLSDEKYLKSIIENPNIKAIVIKKDIINVVDIPKNIGLIESDNPKLTFYTIHNLLADRDFYWAQFKNDISQSAIVSNNAVIGSHSIRIGENSIIEPNVVIHPGTIIGNNVVIRSGSQIGSNGFQFMNNGETVYTVKTAGKTIIEDYVEIQHNCCVDRGVLGGDTVLKKYVKVDNCVHIAHDNIIGERTFLTAGVIFGGRVIVGKDCWFGLNSTISNGIEIGDNCKITLGSVVTRNVKSNTTVSGNFAIDHNKFIEFIKSIR